MKKHAAPQSSTLDRRPPARPPSKPKSSRWPQAAADRTYVERRACRQSLECRRDGKLPTPLFVESQANAGTASQRSCRLACPSQLPPGVGLATVWHCHKPDLPQTRSSFHFPPMQGRKAACQPVNFAAAPQFHCPERSCNRRAGPTRKMPKHAEKKSHRPPATPLRTSPWPIG